MHELNIWHALLHFGQLPADAQLARFYLRLLKPVSPAQHLAAVDLDNDCDLRITNPAYQLFAALVLHDFSIMYLADAIELDARHHAIVEDHRFSDDFKRDFVHELAWNTSEAGFRHGTHWQRIRGRCKRLQQLLDVGPAPSLPTPMKFCEFVYPDEVAIYQPYPMWTSFGQFIPEHRWADLRAAVLHDYRHEQLRVPVTGFGLDP